MAAASNFLDVPTHYGLNVDDIVHFQRDGRTNSKQDELTGITPETGAGAVLVAKVCDALVRQGYEDEIVQKVGRLVAANLITCASTQVGEEAGLETMIQPDEIDDKSTQRTVELMLKGLLDRNAARSKSVNVNSNEPVLLINGSDGIERQQLIGLVRKTVQQLQNDWNLWPVRVYAGRYFPSSERGFSISLLNVVNTDIGGPSMVQLLDEQSDYPGWHQFVRREVWRDRDLLHSEEGHSGYGEEGEDVSDGESVHSADSNSSYAAESVLRLVIEKSPTMADSPIPADNPDVVEEGLDGLSSSVDQEAIRHEDDVDDGETSFAVLEEEQSNTAAAGQGTQERNIVHPTWNRRHDSTSLIDLIRSQALDIPPLGTEDETRVEPLETAAEEPLPPEASKKSDESFVWL